MVFTLHRYIFREVFKVFVLTAVALTLIMSLGSILRPVQEYGAGPRQVFHLMGYSLPITLTFVLPMAALFAATLVYGRFEADNELDACSASGVSMFTLLYPGIALAIIVAIANLILSFYVIPAFVQRAESSFKNDAKQIFFRNIQRRGYYKLPPHGRYRIYADNANMKNDTLSGVVITEMKNDEIENIITAETAKVNFNPHKRFNEVQITAYKTCQMHPDGDMVSFEWLPLTAEFGTLLSDDIAFKKIDEMKKIQIDPMRFYPIEKLARKTYAQFTTELLAQDINAKATANTTTCYKLYSDRKLIEFTAENCTIPDEKKIELSGQVIVIEYDIQTKRPLRTLHSKKALLYLRGDELAPTLTMDIYNPTWQQADQQEHLAQRLVFRGLVLPKAVTDKFVTEDILKAVSPASTTSALQKTPGSRLLALQKELQRKIQKTLVEISAEIHSRLVFGIGCVLVIMIGIGLGVILKGGHLLSAFGVSSIPAAILIVCIMMGKNVTKNPAAQPHSGIVLIWSGLAFLCLLTVVVYRKLLKK